MGVLTEGPEQITPPMGQRVCGEEESGCPIMQCSWNLHRQNKLVSQGQESGKGQSQGPGTRWHLLGSIAILSGIRSWSPVRLCGEKRQWEDQMDQWAGSKKRRVIDQWLGSPGGSLWLGDWRGGGQKLRPETWKDASLGSWRLRRQSSRSG